MMQSKRLQAWTLAALLLAGCFAINAQVDSYSVYGSSEGSTDNSYYDYENGGTGYEEAGGITQSPPAESNVWALSSTLTSSEPSHNDTEVGNVTESAPATQPSSAPAWPTGDHVLGSSGWDSSVPSENEPARNNSSEASQLDTGDDGSVSSWTTESQPVYNTTQQPDGYGQTNDTSSTGYGSTPGGSQQSTENEDSYGSSGSGDGYGSSSGDGYGSTTGSNDGAPTSDGEDSNGSSSENVEGDGSQSESDQSYESTPSSNDNYGSPPEAVEGASEGSPSGTGEGYGSTSEGSPSETDEGDQSYGSTSGNDDSYGSPSGNKSYGSTSGDDSYVPVSGGSSERYGSASDQTGPYQPVSVDDQYGSHTTKQPVDDQDGNAGYNPPEEEAYGSTQAPATYNSSTTYDAYTPGPTQQDAYDNTYNAQVTDADASSGMPWSAYLGFALAGLGVLAVVVAAVVILKRRKTQDPDEVVHMLGSVLPSDKGYDYKDVEMGARFRDDEF